MINLHEDFKRLIEMDKEILADEENHFQLIKERQEYFTRITRELNNHRAELRDEHGLSDYNYADVCKLEDADTVVDMMYHFKVVFNKMPSAKMLSVIEDITGCQYVRSLVDCRDYKYYFKLPEVYKYNIHRR